MGGGGSGGSTNISGPYGTAGGNRNPDTEWPYVNRGYGNQIDQFNQFVAGSPLLNTAGQGALGFFNNLGNLTGPLQSLEQQTPGFFSGLQNEIGGIQSQVPGLQNQLSSIYGGLGGLFNQSQGLLNNLPNVSSLTNPLRGTLGDETSAIQNVYNPVVQSGGALTGQQLRDATQQARTLGPSGSLQNPGAIASEVLNRDNAKDQRLGLYSGLMNNAASTQGGLAGQIQNLIGSDTSLRSGLLGQQAGILGQQGQTTQQQSGLLGLMSALTGQKGSLFGQQAGVTGQLSQGQQGLQTGGLNQLLGASGAQTSQFSQLTNPILSYIGNLFSGNQQAQIAQAQINEQAQQASNSKTAGGVSGIGSIVGAVLPALMAFSDERTKTKISATGIDTAEGVPLKTFEYKTNPGVRFLGATAQDIEKKMPSAVFTDPRSGLKMIDTTQFPIVQISAVKPTRKAA